MPKCKGRRGPKRGPNSSIKGRCGYCKCRRQLDVKNIGKLLQLPKSKVEPAMCRPLRKNCNTVKFCSLNHKKLCMKKTATARGGREPLTHQQCTKLFHVLASFSPWAAMLTLLQLFIGDRADCSRQCTWSWITGIGPDSAGQPTIHIPKVNEKTTARQIPLHQPFAIFLQEKIYKEPLAAPSGETWPIAGQPVSEASLPLFPGFDSSGQKRLWTKPVSERAYFDRIRTAADILAKEVVASKAQGEIHTFEGFDLSKLGTHSFKKTAVTLMSEAKTPWSIIASITGTSIEMLQRCYDVPTSARQRQAMQQAYDGVLLQSPARPAEDRKQDPGAKFCGFCGTAKGNARHVFCTTCGSSF